MAFYNQYGQYPQPGYGNQYQYNYQSNAPTASQSTYRLTTSSTANAQQPTSQPYSNQQYSYGYSAPNTATTNTSTSQHGNSYQQFSNLWYAHTSPNPAPTQQAQHNVVQQQQSQQPNRAPQQMNPPLSSYQQMNQYYQPTQYAQQTFQQNAQQQQQQQQQQYKPPNKPAQQVTQTAQSTGQQSRNAIQNQSGANNQQGDWANTQKTNDYYNNYNSTPKPNSTSAGANWTGYGQQPGKDWSATQYPNQQINQNKNGYQGSATGGAGGDYNYNQGSTIQHPPQIYTAQPRNYQQGPQGFHGYQQGPNQRNNVSSDQHRGYGDKGPLHHFGANQENRSNWNAGPAPGQGNWNAGPPGNWGAGGGWGDWNGPRNNPRRPGDAGPHIPPFPQAWQIRGQSQPSMHAGGNRGDQRHGNWSGSNNWNQGWEGQGRQGPNPGRFQRGGDGQQQNRNGKYSPNSRLSRGTKNEKSNRELWTPGETKRVNKEKEKAERIKPKEPTTTPAEPEKAIQANEIKAYLYAWLGMRRMRPHYDIHPLGERPDQTFRCELRVSGYKFVGVGEAPSKKDAQTDAAWNFADFLVRQGQLKKTELPPKTKNQEETNEEFGTVKEYEYKKEKPPPREANRHRNRPPRTVQKGPIPSLMSIVTSPMGNIPPFPPFERHPENWIPMPRRPGPWMEGPGVPWRGAPPRGRGGWIRQHENWRREMMEEQWIEEEFQHPEDIFINRMIMNQQEATMGVKRFEGRPGEWVSLAPARARNVMTLDDKHVMTKHAAIYPREEELKSVHEMVTLAERALKALSDQFVDEDHPIPKDEDDDEAEEEEIKKGENAEDTKKEDDDDKSEKKTKIQILKRPKKRFRKVPDTRPRVLCAVNRVGTLAKGLLIHGDINVCLVLLCGSMPTKQLLNRIMKHLPIKIKEINSNLKYELAERESGFVIIGHVDCIVTLTVTLTCTSLTTQGKQKKSKEESDHKKETNEEQNLNLQPNDEVEEKAMEVKSDTDADPAKIAEDSPDMLPKPLLMASLAQLRHAKWFQARASQQDCGVVITRIVRDMKMRIPEWRPLSDWALENLVYVALSSSTEHMSPGDALRRFFEVVAGGVLLQDRTGILDPCERHEVDVLDCCTGQQLENMTRHAQNALLKIAFRKVHEVLDMEKISMLNPRGGTEYPSPSHPGMVQEEDEKEGARKRRLEHNSSDSLAESPKRSLTDEEDADTQQNLADLRISDQLKVSLSTAKEQKETSQITSNLQLEDQVETMETDN